MPPALSALSVFTPAAWWALLALFIPILIHLFNRSRGRLVRIGHIDLVRQARRIRVTEVKLAQWLLLLLRLGIFTLAALILAGLAMPGLKSSTAATIYVTPAWLASAGANDIEELLASIETEPETRTFLLEAGFPPLGQEQLYEQQLSEQQLEGQQPGDSNPPSGLNTQELSNVWPLLAETLSLEHHRGPVTVYATDYIVQFGSHQPRLPREVNWSVRHPHATPQFSTAAIHAVIAHEQNRSSDAISFGAVLAILKQHRLPGLTWETTNAAKLDEKQLNADWLILLGDSGLNPAQLALIKTPTVILTDADGNSSFESTQQFIDLPFYPFTRFRLNRYIETDTNSAAQSLVYSRRVLLATEGGSPILLASSNGTVRWLHFNSRFDSKWSSIAQQLEFPDLLLQLMSDGDFQPPRFADARINPVQLEAVIANTDDGPPLPRRSLQRLLALILVLLWVTERWLSERKPREPV